MVVICGPTGTGKTSIGIELAKEFGGEIISADSGAVYKDLDIGTAKPSKEERAHVPHHLIDIIEPNESFDAARFVALADNAISDIVARGKLPIVVGGTGLYIKALIQGLADAPPRDDEYRKELEAIRREKGTPYLYKLLTEKDPKTALKLKANDSTRVIRALEVFHSTGRSISEIHKEHKFKERRHDALKIGITLPREELYKKVEERVDGMIKAGLEDEVRGLVERFGSDAQALKAVGYKEMVRKLAPSEVEGCVSVEVRKEEDVAELIKRNTRHYAKRQLTWFRADKEIKWFEYSRLKEIKKVLADFLG
ncbi:MAG: tRNA (adenosine(37)-N6)-dimethylallyltransferase MiaA [Deltaproteobacteria bacterium CG11_big_fil_rev_8_21_14_0_20_49_13]|nr:MAG: tRNA (adenosine(37)-N6)-dimethylallyltransferase MiaA [Deltaproteobacteria bacterium CG11_big_fil_rev_8_21_14_0_20_49_13]